MTDAPVNRTRRGSSATATPSATAPTATATATATTATASAARGATASAAQSKAPGRRERAKADKRARILAAALELFDERGYEATSMSEVARLADVAVGTVFQYAATKPELLMMVTASLWQACEDADTGAADASPPTPARADQSDEGAAPAALIAALIEPLVQAMRRWPEPTTWVAREILFGAEGEHRLEVLGFVERLEGAIARLLAVEPEDGAAGARLIVTGVLVELNRARQGRADAASLAARLRGIIDIVVAGVGCADRPTARPPRRR